MKKQLAALALVLVGLSSQAQDYNKWSIDVNGGVNKPVAQMSSGSFTSTPSFWTVDGGIRYMFSNKVGIRLGGGYDSFKNSDDSKKTFESSLWNVNLQGYVNLGRVLNFETWTSSLGLLTHAGFGYGRLSSDNLKSDDQIAFGVAGISPQIKLSERVTLFADGSVYLNGRQQNTFDTYAKTTRRGIQGVKFTATAGLSIALGKAEKHADWYVEPVVKNDFEERLTQLENDVQQLKNTVRDENGNNVPDAVESYLEANYAKKGYNAESPSGDIAADLIKNGYVSVYFDFNVDRPQADSMWANEFVIKYLKENPSATINLVGYADELGSDNYNQRLSERRANNVKQLLVAAGIDASRISAKGLGEDKSINQRTADARQLARRVTFSF